MQCTFMFDFNEILFVSKKKKKINHYVVSDGKRKKKKKNLVLCREPKGC